MELKCDCNDWIVSANQIFGAQTTLYLIKGIKYTGKDFEYCPWCGKKLIDEDKWIEK